MASTSPYTPLADMLAPAWFLLCWLGYTYYADGERGQDHHALWTPDCARQSHRRWGRFASTTVLMHVYSGPGHLGHGGPRASPMLARDNRMVDTPYHRQSAAQRVVLRVDHHVHHRRPAAPCSFIWKKTPLPPTDRAGGARGQISHTPRPWTGHGRACRAAVRGAYRRRCGTARCCCRWLHLRLRVLQVPLGAGSGSTNYWGPWSWSAARLAVPGSLHTPAASKGAARLVRALARIASSTGRHFNRGIRAHYFALAALSWFIQRPWLFMLPDRLG